MCGNCYSLSILFMCLKCKIVTFIQWMNDKNDPAVLSAFSSFFKNINLSPCFNKYTRYDVSSLRGNTEIELYSGWQLMVDRGISSQGVKSVSVSELCNLLQFRQTGQGQTGCRDNDPSLSEARSLWEERRGEERRGEERRGLYCILF